MQKLLFFVRRLLRRSGIVLMVGAVLTSIVLGWLFDQLNNAARALIRVFGLRRVEDWLRRQPLWFPLTLLALMLIGFVAFKAYELNLLFHGHISFALTLALIFKVVYVGILNYLLHLYAEHFLAIAWIARWYKRYEEARAHVLNWLHEQTWYKRARLIKMRITLALKRRSLLKIAQRILRRRPKQL